MNSVPLGVVEAAREILAARERGAATVLALVLGDRAAGADDEMPSGEQDRSDAGRRRLVVAEADGSFHHLGALVDPELEAAVDALQREMIQGHGPGRKRSDAGTHTLSVSGEPVQVYLERTDPTPGLLIVGAGHIAGPLHLQGALLGFRVTVADDRPEYADSVRFPRADRVVRMDFSDPFAQIPPGDRTHVVLVTRGHKYDYECLRRLLREERPPRYIGMIGSRRRVRATFHQLLEEGVPRRDLARIRAPVGLDLEAETPAEIAVAVAAEWVMLARGGTGRALVQVERIADRFFPEAEAEGGGIPAPESGPTPEPERGQHESDG